MTPEIAKRVAFAATAALASIAIGCGDTDSPGVALCSAPPEASAEDGAATLTCKEGTGLSAATLELAQVPKTQALFSTELGRIACRQVRGKARVEVERGAVQGAVTKLEFAWCRHNVDFCSTLNELAIDTPIEPLEIRYLGERTPQGRLIVRGPSAFVSLACTLIGEVACSYGADDVLAGEIENPPAQRLRFDAQLKLARGVESCPQTATVRMVTDVKAVNVVREDGTRLESSRIWVAKG